MNLFSQVICLPDLLRTQHTTASSFFDLIREPILQGCCINIEQPPGSRKPHPALAAFDLQRFNTLSANGEVLSPEALWFRTYHNIPNDAVDYLFTHISNDTLLLTTEIPPWLRQACKSRGIHFLDVRYSPLRFGRDLYIALHTSCDVLARRITALAVTDEELRLEAAFLAANMRAHRSRLAANMRNLFDLDNTLIFARQPPMDIALLERSGRFQQPGDFTEQIRKLAADRRILFTMDYPLGYIESTSEQERIALSQVLGLPVGTCPQSIYQILSADENFELCGISSGVLQEAVWFGKKSHILGKPFTPLASDNSDEQLNYMQVHHHEILAPLFWHQVLTPDAPLPRLARLPMLDRHHGREMFEEWGDYEKVLHWERSLPWHAYERSGGIVQRHRVDAMERILVSAPSSQETFSFDTNCTDMRARIRQLKNSKCGQTAYILGNAPSLMTLDINELMRRESFWCNKSFKLKDNGFNYQPKYYLLWEPIGFQQWQQDIINIDAGIRFVGPELYSYIEKTQPDLLKRQNFLALKEASRHAGNLMFNHEDNFSYDPSICIYDGCTVILIAVQIAFYMGYSRVLIGGVDLDYSQPYFYGETNPHRRNEDDVITKNMRQSFLTAKKNFEKNGRTLAKITQSPNLPLEYFDDQEIQC